MNFLADANVLIALMAQGHVEHARAHAFFGKGRFAVCPQVQLAALRFLTHPRILGGDVYPPLSKPVDAIRKLQVLCNTKATTFLPESLSAATVDFHFVTGHRQWNDFYLVALAKKNRLKLATFEAALGEFFPDDVKVIP